MYQSFCLELGLLKPVASIRNDCHYLFELFGFSKVENQENLHFLIAHLKGCPKTTLKEFGATAALINSDMAKSSRSRHRPFQQLRIDIPPSLQVYKVLT